MREWWNIGWGSCLSEQKMWCEGDELEIEKKEDKMTPKYVGRF